MRRRKYTQKFYLNPDFDSLPNDIKQELKILCVLFTEDIGGVIELQFNNKGNIVIVTDSKRAMRCMTRSAPC